MDPLFLSRIQFALTSCFHYIYPPMSIGLGLLLVITEGIYLKTKKPIYKQITRFWVKIFAVTFALGVATGLVQLFGFGTNWSQYSKFVGDVFGSALGAEGVFAFFLEAGFLGLMLFGWERVSARLHYFSTVMVALGAHFSAIWIVVANSWMQTPTGFKVVGEGDKARAVVTDFWAMVFNPSSSDRLTHVILGCWLTGIFFMVSVSAYYMLKKKYPEFTRICMKISLMAAAIVLALQLVSGDDTARGVARNQPAKLAAIEGVYKTQEYTPITALGWVDKEKEKVVGLQVPGVLSFMVYRDFKKPIAGLDQVPVDLRPNVPIVFQTYHLMVMMWVAMALCTFLALIAYAKGKLHRAKFLLKALVVSVIFPHIANQTGWMTAEMGRQPWVVYGLLKTAEGLSPNLETEQVLASIIMFIVIYLFLFALFLFLLDHKIKEGPEQEEKDLVYTRNILD